MAQLRGWPGKSTRLGEAAFLCTSTGVGLTQVKGRNMS